jgi:mannan endo-1,4-beta-mannosidase
MRKLIKYAVIVLIVGCGIRNEKQNPVNPSASKEAVALLDFLYSIKGKYILSGEHNFVSSGSKYNEKVKEITGKYPVVWGSDFSFCITGDNASEYHHCGPMNLVDPVDSFAYLNLSQDTLRSRMIKEAIRQWNNGHIITLMWHQCFPADGDTCVGSSIWAMENRPDQKIWDSLTTDGTALNMAWKKQADGVAKYLKILCDAHVPVLWRPYHEMNGVWFWWCNHKGENGFKKLWIMMYNYYTKEHNLNNLLWVWDSNAPRNNSGDEAFSYDQFYPGNEYVDVLAADIYQRDFKQSHHDELVKLGNGKPISIGEVGELPNDSMLIAQPDWEWFMVWGYFINMRNNKTDDVRALYNSPRVLTLDKVMRNADGVFSISK